MSTNTYKICVNEKGEIVTNQNGQILVWNQEKNEMSWMDAATSGSVVEEQAEAPVAAQESAAVVATNEAPANETEPQCQLPIKQQASWKDDNAVKSLIFNWKRHEAQFKSINYTNDQVWKLISEELLKENPLWAYSGKQCENKFKDIRKVYTKTKDNNLVQSGRKVKTCKFFAELEEVLGDKPIVKPVSIASSMHKKINPTHDSSMEIESEASENECSPKSTKPKKKKSRLSKELEEFGAAQKSAALEREEAREKRHRERIEMQAKALEVYERAMGKLLEKL